MPDVWEPEMDLHYLEVEFIGEEIKKVVWELGPNITPIPYWLLLFFFQYFQEIMRVDYKKMIVELTRMTQIELTIPK